MLSTEPRSLGSPCTKLPEAVSLVPRRQYAGRLFVDIIKDVMLLIEDHGAAPVLYLVYDDLVRQFLDLVPVGLGNALAAFLSAADLNITLR